MENQVNPPAELAELKRDLSIFQKLNLEKQPVDVKFLFGKPEGISRLDKKLGLCEMIPEAQTGKAFYAGVTEDGTCPSD